MADIKFNVMREHGTDPFYSEGDTRELTALDAATLVRNGVLEPATDAGKKAMAEVFAAEPAAQTETVVQRVPPPAQSKEDKAKAAADAKAEKAKQAEDAKAKAEADAKAKQIAEDDAKAKAAGEQGTGTEQNDGPGETGDGAGGTGGGNGPASGETPAEPAQTLTSANANPNARTGRRR